MKKYKITPFIEAYSHDCKFSLEKEWFTIFGFTFWISVGTYRTEEFATQAANHDRQKSKIV